jgi:hypothetical protein
MNGCEAVKPASSASVAAFASARSGSLSVGLTDSYPFRSLAPRFMAVASGAE